MTITDVHFNESIFPDPRAFKPERWLSPDSKKKLEPYLVPFSRGSRSCLGIKYVYACLFSFSFLFIFGGFHF